MEIWKEAFVGVIPVDDYQIKLLNGEETGLVIELIGQSNNVIITFGRVQAIRMLDEGIVQNDTYSNQQIKKFKPDRFKNVIYEVQGGKFEKQIQRMTEGYWSILDVKHYIIITQNYNIDIITEYVPSVEVVK